jgi:hypothetical protein
MRKDPVSLEQLYYVCGKQAGADPGKFLGGQSQFPDDPYKEHFYGFPSNAHMCCGTISRLHYIWLNLTEINKCYFLFAGERSEPKILRLKRW